jgi:hypothetical protein
MESARKHALEMRERESFPAKKKFQIVKAHMQDALLTGKTSARYGEHLRRR